MYNLLGKEIRGRFGFPSGVITTNSDIARYMFEQVPQFGFYQGKSTTVEPTVGNREDILTQPTPDSMWNAVGYTNPGLEATVEGFRELREATPPDVFLMAQIGESTEEKFSHSVDAFEQAGDTLDPLRGHIEEAFLDFYPQLRRFAAEAIAQLNQSAGTPSNLAPGGDWPQS